MLQLRVSGANETQRDPGQHAKRDGRNLVGIETRVAGFLGITSGSQEFSLWTSIMGREETYDLSVQAAMCPLYHLNCSLFVKGPRKTTSPDWSSVSIADMMQHVKQPSELSLRKARGICYLA